MDSATREVLKYKLSSLLNAVDSLTSREAMWVLEMANHVSRVFEKKLTGQESTDALFNQCCWYFRLPEMKVKRNYKGKPVGATTSRTDIKRLIIKTMLDNTLISQRQLAKKLGYRNHSMVSIHYRDVNHMLTHPSSSYNKLKDDHRRLLEFLNIPRRYA